MQPNGNARAGAGLRSATAGVLATVSTRPQAPAQDALADDELVARIGRDRDADAFTEFFNRHKSSAFSLALYILRDRSLAEESVQEAMLAVWRNAERFEPGNARGWMLRIVAQICLRTQVRAQRKRALMKESDDLVRAAPAREAAGESANEKDELRAALRDTLGHLPDRDRRLIALYYGGGMTQAEIADEMDVSQRTVSEHLKRVLAVLRSRLEAAGCAAAVPLLNPQGIGLALTTGEALPGSLHAGAVQELLARVARTSARELSRRVAPHAFGLGSALLAAAALIAAAGAYLAFRTPPGPAPAGPSESPRAGSPPPAPPPAEQPGAAKVAKDAGVDRVWDFAKGPDDSLTTFLGTWAWQPRRGRLDAGMAGPADSYMVVYLPVKFPKQPVRIRLRFQWNVPEKNARANAVWGVAQAKGVVENVCYARKSIVTEIPARSETVVYFYDRWAVEICDGTVGSVREFPEPYPVDTICAAFINRVVQSIEAKTITMEDIPEAYRDPKKVIQREGLAADATYIPPKPEQK